VRLGDHLHGLWSYQFYVAEIEAILIAMTAYFNRTGFIRLSIWTTDVVLTFKLTKMMGISLMG
jgi:hypothetical protein